MNRLRTFLCASFLVAALSPALLHAQAATPQGSRSVVGTELKLVIPASLRVYSPGVTPRGQVAGLSRRWLQDSARTGQQVPVVLPYDSTTTSTRECAMPVFRMAPEAVPHMPTAQIDSAFADPGVVTLRGCTNPLDPRP